VCYEINGKIFEVEAGEGYKHDYESFGKASFLGFILRANYEYKEELKWKLKVCGITIMSDEDSDEVNDEIDLSNDSNGNVSYNEESHIEGKKEYSDKNTGKRQDKRISSKKNAASKISGFFTKIKDCLSDFQRTIIKFKNFFVSLKELFENERFNNSLKFILNKIIFVLKKIAPHIKHCLIEFGTDDPALTGKITGAACAFRGMFGANMNFIPDFDSERAYINADIKMKGKIRACHFVKLVYYYFCNKEVKYFKHMIIKTRRKL